MWLCWAARVPSGLCRAGMGCFVVFIFTVLKHSGSVSSCIAFSLAISLAPKIAFLNSLLAFTSSLPLVLFFTISRSFFLIWARSLFQNTFALPEARGVCLSMLFVSFPWTVDGSSSCLKRWISVSIFPQSALSYLNGLSAMLLHISLVLISSALCSVEAMVLCFILTPQEGFAMTGSIGELVSFGFGGMYDTPCALTTLRSGLVSSHLLKMRPWVFIRITILLLSTYATTVISCVSESRFSAPRRRNVLSLRIVQNWLACLWVVRERYYLFR